VRVSVSTTEEHRVNRVRIGVLVCGDQDGFEHIRRVATRNYIFTGNDQGFNKTQTLSVFSLGQKAKENFFSVRNVYTNKHVYTNHFSDGKREKIRNIDAWIGGK
jgi:hypothetical protein